MTNTIEPPLRLEATFFEDVHVTPNRYFQESEEGFEDLTFEVELGEHPENDHVFRVSVRVACSKSDDANDNRQYFFDVKASGVVELSGSLMENAEMVLRLTVAPMVYSSIREMLLGLTSRSGNGPYMLPAVNPRAAFGWVPPNKDDE